MLAAAMYHIFGDNKKKKKNQQKSIFQAELFRILRVREIYICIPVNIHIYIYKCITECGSARRQYGDGWDNGGGNRSGRVYDRIKTTKMEKSGKFPPETRQ